MSRKNYRRNLKRGTFSKIVSVCVVVLAVGLFLYENVPAFKSKTDELLSFFSGGKSENTESTVPQTESDSVSPAQKESDGQISEKSPQNAVIALPSKLENPLCAAKNHAEDHELRDYEYYSICYRESYEQAEWSAYCLTEEHLEKNAARSDDFRPDPEISTGSASLADYRGSGYDRGHLSPAADFAFDAGAMSETFYMSNMSPQAGSFNRGMWKDLEATVRAWAKKFGRVYVVSGPVLEKPAAEYESIGEDKVTVPKYYYKVLLAPLYENEEDAATPDDAENICALGFIFPNEKCEGSFYDFAVSIDEIERRTGLDFFSGLDGQTQERIESSVNLEEWK